MAGPSEGVPAPVVRCHQCNVQSTYIPPAPVPERCPTCGRKLERQADATVVTTSIGP